MKRSQWVLRETVMALHERLLAEFARGRIEPGPWL
jgi:hypothetical protein